MPGAAGSGMPPVTSSRSAVRRASAAAPRASIAGAITTSAKSLAMASAVAASSGRLTAMMPP